MKRFRRALRAFGLAGVALCGVNAVAAAAELSEPATQGAQAPSGQTTPSKNVTIRSTAARSGNHDPINIEAAKLDYYDKQQKLIYRGHVIAVRGDTTLKTPLLVVFLNPKEAGSKGPPSSDSQVKRMEAAGPVTIIAKDQIATGDAGTYEKIENKIYLNGNVTLSQGPNVTKGDRLVYDTTTGQAVVTGHVRSMFLPNNNATATTDANGGPKPQQ